MGHAFQLLQTQRQKECYRLIVWADGRWIVAANRLTYYEALSEALNFTRFKIEREEPPQ